MRRKRQIAVILINLLILAVYLGIQVVKVYEENNASISGTQVTEKNGEDNIPFEYSGKVMGIPIVENADFLEGMNKLKTEENPGICFEDTIVPYSKSGNTLYLSQDYEKTEWVGKLSVALEDAFLCTLQDAFWNEKRDAIKAGHSFSLWCITKDGYYEFDLVISGMPVISMTTQYSKVQKKVPYEIDPDKLYYDSEDLYYGEFRVFNPGVGTGNYEIVESGVRYHYKGATSKAFSKGSYALSLRGADQRDLDVSLLGMRADNSWKLNALCTDVNAIREKTAAQIWEEFDLADAALNTPGPRMEYVELILDDDYRGVYCLVEPVDEKKVGLDDNDALYKMIDYTIVEDGDIQHSIDKKWKIRSSIRVRYPKDIADYSAAWYPIRDYLNTFYRGQVTENAADKLYLDNAVDMLMYTEVISGSDNYFKNIYFAADVSPEGTYKMRQLPWDLDYTFGNMWTLDNDNRVYFNPDVTVSYHEKSVPYLAENDAKGIKELLESRWTTYRKSFLSTQEIQKKLTDNRDYLINTGAVERQNARWPQYAISTDIEYLLEYQADRMQWLDEYIMSFAQ